MRQLTPTLIHNVQEQRIAGGAVKYELYYEVFSVKDWREVLNLLEFA